MLLGVRKLGAARLTLAPSDALPDHLQEIIEVSAVATDPEWRRKGMATALLEKVCEEADSAHVVLMLMPGEDNWLESWYARFGFATIQTKPEILMARPPKVLN